MVNEMGLQLGPNSYQQFIQLCSRSLWSNSGIARTVLIDSQPLTQCMQQKSLGLQFGPHSYQYSQAVGFWSNSQQPACILSSHRNHVSQKAKNVYINLPAHHIVHRQIFKLVNTQNFFIKLPHHLVHLEFHQLYSSYRTVSTIS